MVRAKSMAQIQFDERHNKRGRITKKNIQITGKKQQQKKQTGREGKNRYRRKRRKKTNKVVRQKLNFIKEV